MATELKMKRSSVASKIPTTSQLELGEIAINTYDGKMYIKKDDGTAAIVEIGSGGGGNGALYERDSFTATSGQTQFTITSNSDLIEVYMNGLILNETDDYTVSNNVITLTSGATANDELEIINYISASILDPNAVVDDITFNGTTDGLLEWDGSNLSINNNNLLTTADEGTGNGLDADTVDGIEASAFALLSGANFSGNVDFASGIDVTGNITVTGTVDGRDVAADGTKLDTIETNAKDDQNASEVPFTNTTSGLTATDVQDAIDEVEGRLDTAETKLSGIEAGATADQTASEIKTAYESNSNTNAFTDAEKTKLSGIEANADVTDATNVDAAGAVMNSDTSVASMSFVIDEDTMASNSATKVPTQQSVKAYVDTEISGLVDSAPGTLDTLNELAAALGDDANFSTTITNSIATKLPLAGGTLTGALYGTSGDFSGNFTIDGSLFLNNTFTLENSSDRSGLLEINQSGGSYTGVQFRHSSTSYWSVMGDQDDFYIYDDYNSDIVLAYDENAGVRLYYNGSQKFNTATSGINVSGNITLTGTVDGRDVATDGAKLDNINQGVATTDSPTFVTVNATTVDFGDWTITESNGSLYFATGGTNKMKLDANGNLDVVGNVNSGATIT